MLPLPVYRSFFIHSPAGEIVLSREFTILDVNESFLRACGRPREELMGRYVFDVFPGNPDDPQDTGAADLRGSLDRVVRTGQPDRLALQRYSLRVTLPDGTQGFEERLWSALSTPILDEAGELVCIAHSTVDITDKTRAEAALRSSTRRQAFQLALADRIRHLDSPAEIMAAASEMLGRELDIARVIYVELDETGESFSARQDWSSPHHGLGSMAGRRLRLDDLGPGLVAGLRAGHPVRVADVRADPQTAGHLGAYQALGIGAHMAVPLVKSGRMPALLSLQHTQPRHWNDDDLLKCQDTAERTWAALEEERARAELREANQRKDEFLAMLAHELRNPLAPISVAAQLMESGRLDASKMKQTSQVISRQVRHMTGLVDDLLDVSRVTRGLVALNKTPQDMRGVVANAVEQVRPLMEAQGHRFAVELGPEVAHVLGDAKRLVQILTNLLNNAAKYTRPGGEVTLRMRVQDMQVVLQVQDNGIGIAPQLQPRVFDLFVQAERSSDRSQGGLGLGLALVKSLAELHGGQVSCHSEGPDRGSCFTVRLPQLASTTELVERRSHRRDPGPAAMALQVLVVDDNLDAAQMLAVLLQTVGHAVVVAHNGAAALQAAHRTPPDVCLLDIGLPDIDGNELSRRLRADADTAGAVMIAITGYGQEQDRRTALAAGFDHYLVKPVNPVRLIDLLNGLAAANVRAH